MRIRRRQFTKYSQAEGINIQVNANCIHLEQRGDGVSVGVECNEGDPHVEGSHVLLAVGRMPNTADLNLAAAGSGGER